MTRDSRDKQSLDSGDGKRQAGFLLETNNGQGTVALIISQCRQDTRNEKPCFCFPGTSVLKHASISLGFLMKMSLSGKSPTSVSSNAVVDPRELFLDLSCHRDNYQPLRRDSCPIHCNTRAQIQSFASNKPLFF